MRGIGHGALGVGAAVVLLGCMAHPPGDADLPGASTEATAVVAAHESRQDASARIVALERASVQARLAWEQAVDRVLDESARTELDNAIANADRVVAEARQRVVWPDDSVEKTVAVAAASLVGASSSLESRVAELSEAVADWESEQARLKAEAEAQAAAEAARHAAATSTRTSGYVAAPPSSGVVHVEGIWAAGEQAEIDACRGSVNMVALANYLGAAFYAAEHWSCGGRAWGGIGEGALVEFPGYGIYQVAGRVGGLSYGADASALPLDYAGYYQTCVGGSTSNMTVWLLTRVG